MSVKIIFVIPASCKNEKECDPTMIEAFQIATSHKIEKQWVHANDPNAAKYETSKTDCIVFQDMSGDFYKRVLQSKSVILSPLCLLQCLKEEKQIPKSESRLVSLAMENCIVVCSALPKESKRDLKAKVQAMAGIFCLQLVSDTTYLITDGVRSEKYNTAVEQGKKIMTVHFIDALWEQGKTRIVHASDEEFQKYKCPAFLNLNVCSTGFLKHETHIQELVEKHGGNFCSTMDVNKTDILVCKSSASTSSMKYKSAVKYKIDCVTEDWIVDSAAQGFALSNVKDYSVKAATSTPTKRDGFDAPNMSQLSMIMKPTSQLSETNALLIVEETVNMSYLPANNTPLQQVDSQDDVINSIDIKKAKAAGLFLDGCVIYLAGFKPEQKEKLCKILNFSGATSCFSLNDQITHAILGSDKCPEYKQFTSKNFPCAIVNVTWLVDSMNAQMPVEVSRYQITTNDKPEADPLGAGSSPLCKKGLSFLRSDMTIVKKDEPNAEVPDATPLDNNDDLQRYFTGMQTRDSIDDALAAFVNPAIGQPQADVTSPKAPDTSKANASSPSISITMEETVVSIFANLKFMIVDFSGQEEAVIAECIKEVQGTVVSAHFKGIPDYAVVPIGNKSTSVTATHVVTTMWVTDCGEQRQVITDLQYYHVPLQITARVLSGAVITLSGFVKSEKEFLAQLVIELGGAHQDCMSRYTVQEKNTLASTHLIIAEPTGKKYQGALRWGLPVLNKDWLLQCAEQGRWMDENDFSTWDGKENQSTISTASKQILKTKLAETFASPKSTPKQQRLSENVVQTPRNDALRRRTLFEDHESPMPSTSTRRPYADETPNRKPLACSQMTPVNEIMARVRQMCGDVHTPDGGTPKTPGNQHLNDSMSTPDTPYGAIFQNPPPPEMRKRWKRWVDRMPEPYKSPGTPLSEIKRQFWKKYYETHSLDGTDKCDVQNVGGEIGATGGNAEVPVFADTCNNETGNTMNNFVLDKLDELDALMMTTGDKTRRQSVKIIDCNAGDAPDRETQPLTVGWDEDIVIPVTAPPKTKMFMISGVNIDERAAFSEKLERLGASISELSNFDPSATHLLCEKLNRNEKLLASMASGLWILHISYATDSAAAGKLLNEEDYEFGSPTGMYKFKLDSDSMQRASAARHWRQEISRRGYGAFHDIRAIVLANKKQPMVRVLQAGGAVIVEAEPPFDENVSATHCFLEVKNLDLSQFVPLAQQGILCVNTLFVNDFLQRTSGDINDFIVPGFRKYY